jgi:hypothetical protein
MKVEELSEKAYDSANIFLLYPSEDAPVIDENGYWIFGFFLNNLSKSQIMIDMGMDLRIYYQDGNRWFETGNHDISYHEEWVIPGKTEKEYPWYVFIRPTFKKEDMRLRVFISGVVDDDSQTQVTGMIEYIIKDDNLEEIIYINE